MNAIPPATAPDLLVNDVHSQLNPTRMVRAVEARSLPDLMSAIRSAIAARRPLSIAGARHAMGGQQFRENGVLIDMRSMTRLIAFDADAGLAEFEAGATWPDVMRQLAAAQPSAPAPRTFAQKQTGADRLTLGGAVAANIHGRGLAMGPFVRDVEALTLIDSGGRLLRCSRTENYELFRLVIGGYGLFGVVYSVTLRLVRRRIMRRVVVETTTASLMAQFEDRKRAGFVYGDFQYMTNEQSPDFMRKGILACYEPIDTKTVIPDDQRELSTDDWARLLHLAHTDKARAYEAYTKHYMATNGQLYYSDALQCSTYIDDYHAALDRTMCALHRGTEMITELFVPRNRFVAFMEAVANDARQHDSNIIYGTVRLIERDDETFLAWAREPWVCVIVNLHVDHTPKGIVHAADALRRLIDLALCEGGSYYLTYHRFASQEQLRRCYPQFEEFLACKRHYDPEEVFQSDWYATYGVQSAHRARPWPAA